MSIVSCPKCSNPAQKGKFKTWQLFVAICFFPLGLLALLADREPSVCHKCGFMWQ
jgi:hypothetical protein